MIIGGGMAYTFLKIKDSMAIGTSLYDEEGRNRVSSEVKRDATGLHGTVSIPKLDQNGQDWVHLLATDRFRRPDVPKALLLFGARGVYLLENGFQTCVSEDILRIDLMSCTPLRSCARRASCVSCLLWNPVQLSCS